MNRRATVLIGCFLLWANSAAGRDESPFALPFGAIPGDPASLVAVASGPTVDAQCSLVLLVDERALAAEAVRSAVARAFEAWRTGSNRIGAGTQERLGQPSAASLAWLASFTPTLVIDAIEKEMAQRTHDAEYAMFAIDVVDVFALFERVHVAPGATWISLCADDTPVGRLGRRALCRPDWRTTTSSDDQGALEPVDRIFILPHWSDHWHRSSPRPLPGARWPMREAAEVVELSVFVDGVLAKSESPALLRAVVGPCLANSALRESVERKLIPLLDELGSLGDEAAFVLAHMGCTLSALKVRFVAILDSIDDLDAAAWERVPCLSDHDDSTRAAMCQLFERSRAPWELLPMLERSGTLEDPTHGFAADVLSRLDAAESAGAWRAAYDAGVAWRCDFDDRDTPMIVLAKVAIAWDAANTTADERRALLRRFEDAVLRIDGFGGNPRHPTVVWPWFAAELGIRTQRVVDRAVALATTADSSSYAVDALCDYLATCDLNADQRRRLCSNLMAFASSDPPATRLFASFGHDALSRVSMMRDRLNEALRRPTASGRWTAPAESEVLELLEPILAIAGPSEDDRDLLAAALRYGQLEQRLQALRMIVKFRVDGPEVAAALRRAREDLEPRVRAAALEAGQ